MTNIDTQIIFDKNGNPIPQYLDVADKTGGSAGTMKPITGQNGAQFTQLTGSNVEEIVPVSAVAITDTTRRTTGAIDLSKYKKITLTVFSTLNQQVRIGASRGGGDWISFFDGQEWKRVAPPDADALQPNANNLSIANGQWPFLNEGLRQINLAYECQTAPTSGSLTVRIWGVPN